MGFRIAFDLDGVLADMESALVHHAEHLFGPALKRHKTHRAETAPASMSDLVPEEVSENAPLQHELQLTDRQRRHLWRHVRGIDGFWESLEETEPGIVARLATIASERRWEIIFLTRRPATAGATAQIQSQRWLEAKGFPLPSVYVVTGSRGLIAAALTLDIVVDDTPENCVDVVSDSRARAIAILRNTNASPPPILKRMGIRVVHSTDQCLNLVVEIHSTLKHPPGASERIMRTLGLKHPTRV